MATESGEISATTRKGVGFQLRVPPQLPFQLFGQVNFKRARDGERETRHSDILFLLEIINLETRPTCASECVRACACFIQEGFVI